MLQLTSYLCGICEFSSFVPISSSPPSQGSHAASKTFALVNCSALKKQATRSSETSVYHKPKRCHIPEDSILIEYVFIKCSSQCYVKWGTLIWNLNVRGGNDRKCPLAEKVTPSGLQLSIATTSKQGCREKCADVQKYISLELSGYSQTVQLRYNLSLVTNSLAATFKHFFDSCNTFSLGEGGERCFGVRVP
jgi:hypothetical protein